MKICQGFKTDPSDQEVETCSAKSSKDETSLGAACLTNVTESVISYHFKIFTSWGNSVQMSLVVFSLCLSLCINLAGKDMTSHFDIPSLD